ncbi:transport system permease protein [Streptomyces lincolnensis]|uniref:Transport system permease protein n=1 Tax=Streptomyces lincolnensis TaxID=1915 RepID=A0A1B1MKX3_STRLN|nr:MFS transporter [Streptomyces lincolnensis]ANS69260.1 transport system permease protein [Streptomyces lincolnensis]AXG58179.1 transport system permease protein [Streptomyces lincolnensis]QMV10844.1 MFS transporter [Streptomyces lincolnensis]
MTAPTTAPTNALTAGPRQVSGRHRLSPLLRLLILTQLAFNIGFFAVLPFLSAHLGQAVGMAGWLVGFVLGLRTFSQQGLFVVGGALADRYGIRPVVLAGCVLRIGGFAWLGYAAQTWSVICAVLLIGFAAALFSPAVESEVARQAIVHEEHGGSRTRVLALFTVAGQAGAFVGPLIGALLLSVDFRTVCLAGAGIFVLVLAGHAWLLPQHIPGRERVHLRGGMGPLLRNRRFLALCCAYGAYLLAYNQLYLALPAEVERAAGSQAPLAWLFALSSLLVVTAQLPLTRWVGDRLDLRRSMVTGLLLIAAGFAVVAVARPAGWTGTRGLLPAAGFVVLLTLGQMLVAPVARAWVPDLAEEGRLGLYTGALSSVSGLIVLVGSSASGILLDSGLPAAVPWLVLAAVPAAAVALLPRR